MDQIVFLSIAYAVIFSLLVSVSFYTKFSLKIKLALILSVLVFSIVSYSSIRDMQGIPYRDNNFSKDEQMYKILWSGVNEPNKIKKTKGEIFLLLKKTDNNGLERGDPRLYAVGYDPLLLEKILEIRKITKKGIPIVVKLTNLNIKVSRNDQIPDELKGFDKYNSLSGDIDIELEEIISPSLPIK
ncbi:MAG: hypothetical protein HOB71_00140 [Alphaproteobacteria bacterium]|nr:hypothetical protein [Alphaproteobacteria bacterium]